MIFINLNMNKYEIVGIVGEGAYGIVYKAKNKENGEHGKLKTRLKYRYPLKTYILKYLYHFHLIQKVIQPDCS